MSLPTTPSFRVTKAQAVGNDFLVVDEQALRVADISQAEESALAKAICHRHTGIGADGLEILLDEVPTGADAAIRLINSDGSPAELSGNGTRCVAAVLFRRAVAGERIVIQTEAGPREIQRIAGDGPRYELRMDMGSPQLVEREVTIPGQETTGPATILDVGNPQCAYFVDKFDFDWRKVGRATEVHEKFPKGTNVSFVRVIDAQTCEVRFWERGAGETASSGTGSTGAAAAARFRGLVSDDVCIRTVAGDIQIHFDGGQAWLNGPAQIVTEATYFHTSAHAS